MLSNSQSKPGRKSSQPQARLLADLCSSLPHSILLPNRLDSGANFVDIMILMQPSLYHSPKCRINFDMSPVFMLFFHVSTVAALSNRCVRIPRVLCVLRFKTRRHRRLKPQLHIIDFSLLLAVSSRIATPLSNPQSVDGDTKKK